MGKSSGTPKSVLIATRVTPRIEQLVKRMAYMEGLYVSEWIRKLIIDELSRMKMLKTSVYTPSNDLSKDE